MSEGGQDRGPKAIAGRWPHPSQVLIAVAALFPVLSASCNSAGPSPAASPTEEAQQTESPAAQPLVLLMNEFSFTVEGPPVPAGFPEPTATLPSGSSVMVTLRNDGHIVHDWRVGRTLLPEGGYENDLLAMMEPEAVSGTGYQLVEPEEAAAGEPGGFAVEVEPGASVTLRLSVPANASGTWEMGCFIPGHYGAGMKADLRVE